MAISTTTDALSRPEIFCLVAQSNIDNKALAPINLMKGYATLDLIRQDTSTYWGAEQASVVTPGKGRPGAGNFPKVFLEYSLPYCGGGTSDCSVNLCDGVPANPTTEQEARLELTIDNCISRHFTIGKAEFLELCEGSGDRLRKIYSRSAKEIARDLNDQVLREIHGRMGAYSNGDASIGGTAQNLPIINSEGCVNPVAMAKIKQEYRKKNYNGDIRKIGGDLVALYEDVKMYGGINKGTESGANLSAVNGISMTYDQCVDDVFQDLEGDTNSHFITFPAGAFGLFEWFEHTGDCVESYEDLIRNTITIDGMRFDHTLSYDKNCQVWTVILRKWWCLGCIPDEVYCDPEGYKLHWLATCGQISCDTISC